MGRLWPVSPSRQSSERHGTNHRQPGLVYGWIEWKSAGADFAHFAFQRDERRGLWNARQSTDDLHERRWILRHGPGKLEHQRQRIWTGRTFCLLGNEHMDASLYAVRLSTSAHTDLDRFPSDERPGGQSLIWNGGWAGRFANLKRMSSETLRRPALLPTPPPAGRAWRSRSTEAWQIRRKGAPKLSLR